MASNVANNLNSHYRQLASSTQRLSTGLRISFSADDAAGLAIRELMRADIATFQQGMRNANDAISLIQTADGALSVIDEKLIRMKELAEQAATGTYDSTQRLMIESEFQQMAAEIDRIANATDFNGIHLLNGNLSGVHNGSGLTSTGAMKVHFGSGNDSSEDYYYIEIGDCTIKGLGLELGTEKKSVPLISEKITNGENLTQFKSGIVSFAIIPRGTKNINLHLYDHGVNDSIEIFTTSGKHIAGTKISSEADDWISTGVKNSDNANNLVVTTRNAFNDSAKYDGSALNGTGENLSYNNTIPYNQFRISGMNIGYSGDGNKNGNNYEYLEIDNVTEDLVMLSIGSGVFSLQGTWDYMPENTSNNSDLISISTQELAQKALNRITDAVVSKDQIRAHLGALQNRLENTITNITTQAENLQASESQISDVDVATEMTNFVRNQILAQSAVAMLSQANSIPQMAMQLIGG